MRSDCTTPVLIQTLINFGLVSTSTLPFSSMMSSGMCSLGSSFLVASPNREELVVGRVGRGREGGRKVGCSRE